MANIINVDTEKIFRCSYYIPILLKDILQHSFWSLIKYVAWMFCQHYFYIKLWVVVTRLFIFIMNRVKFNSISIPITFPWVLATALHTRIGDILIHMKEARTYKTKLEFQVEVIVPLLNITWCGAYCVLE